MSIESENKEAIIRIEGKLELMDAKIENLRDNHIHHLGLDIKKTNTYIWSISSVIFAGLVTLLYRSFM
tara:strand:- start:2455 stop:2658 length:204 start_codon:yes stop_codon:yes gene_type:complete